MTRTAKRARSRHAATAATVFALYSVAPLSLALGPAHAATENHAAGTLPPVVVKDTSGRPHALPDAAGAVLLLYEDRDTQDENAELKRTLAAGMMAPDAHPRFRLMPVADLEGYDWWPARNYALDAIRKEEKKDDGTVYLDWSGAVRKQWGLPRKRASVVLVASDGRALFQGSGRLTPQQLAELLQRLAAL